MRALTNDVACVVNFISDSISIVDLNNLTLRDSFNTPDEPSDIVFRNTMGQSNVGQAWVSCADPNLIAIFDLSNLSAPPQLLPVLGEDPKHMAISPTGDKIYVALNTSGNNTTILSGGSGLAPNIVSDPNGPHGGQNPPLNGAGVFVPPVNTSNPTPPGVSLIVKKQAGQWLDDTGADWSPYVSGNLASQFGPVQSVADSFMMATAPFEMPPNVGLFSSRIINDAGTRRLGR